MSNWTVFDQDTSAALRAKLPGETVTQLACDPLEHALQLGKTVVAVLPAHGLGQTGLAVLRWNKVAARVLEQPLPEAAAEPPAPIPPAPPAEALPTAAPQTPAERTVRATGFLGLTDEPFFNEEEEMQEKKSWWKRFWEN